MSGAVPQADAQPSPPIGTDEELIVRLRKYGHIEAADALLSRIAEVERLREALRKNAACLTELVAVVRGESPSLLDEDSGGDAKLDIAIDEALERASAALSQHGKV